MVILSFFLAGGWRRFGGGAAILLPLMPALRGGPVLARPRRANVLYPVCNLPQAFSSCGMHHHADAAAVSAFAYGIAYSPSILGIAKLIVYMVLVDFLLIGLCVSTACWWVSPCCCC